MNELQKFDVFGVDVAVDSNGDAYMEIETIAKGFGFVQTKNNIEYVRWERVNDYLREFGYSQRVEKGSLVPENMVYRLGFKAENERGRAFQGLLADKVIPEIRKHGYYKIKAAADDIKSTRAKAMYNNSLAKKSKVILEFAKLTKVDLHRETLITIGVNTAVGKEVMALPPVEKMRNATQVGEMLGISSNKVGRIAKKLSLKADEGSSNEFGTWVSDVAKGNHNKQVQNWMYYQAGIEAIKDYLDNEGN